MTLKPRGHWLASPDISVTQIAHRLGVSPATLYRYIPAARTANTPAFEDVALRGQAPQVSIEGR